MRFSIALVIAIGLSGCSIWNKLDPNLLDAGPSFDGGDGSVDAPFDGGEDAPDANVIERRELVCDDNMDNDRDGVTDCADTDCSSDATECCDPGGVRPPLFTEDWCGGGDLSAWSGPDARLSPLGCFIGQSTGSSVGALIRQQCVPLASGATFTAELDWTGSCEACEATIALSPVPDADPTTGILSELAVRMHQVDGDLVVDLTRAGRLLGRIPESGGLPPGLTLVRLRLFPAVDDEGDLGLRATLFAEDIDGATYSLEPIDALGFPEDLTGAGGGCDVAPGLYLGVQTRGSAGKVGEIIAIPESCPNPNFFRGAGRLPTTWLEAADLELLPAWTAGGIGGASVVPVVQAGTLRWHYFVDGTNLNRANDRDQALDFSFGASFAAGTGLSTFTPRNAGAPFAGHPTPTCIAGGVDCGVVDYREPVAYVPVDGGGSPLIGELFWVELADDRTSVLLQAAYNISSTSSVTGTPVFSTPPCAAVVHPSVVPLGANALLIFACDDAVMGVALDGTYQPTGTPVTLMSQEDLGFSLGIVDLDATVRVRGAVTTFQLWVAGRDADGLTRLALAEGSSTSTTLPTLTPFVGNPVLAVEDPILADGCIGVCRITGVGVAREPETDLVRVVLSVTDESKTVVRHAIVPLEQTLP
jgi:hypothetical protein